MQKYLIFLGMLILVGCGKSLEAKVDFPENVPGKIVFSTTRAESMASVALYKNGEIKIIRKEDSIYSNLSPDGQKILTSDYRGTAIYDAETGNLLEIVSSPNEAIRAWLPKWLEGNKIIAAGTRARHYQGELIKNLWLYEVETKTWKQLTQFKGKEGINSFDVFKGGKKLLCSYSEDWEQKGTGRGTYILNLETGEMAKVADWARSYKILPDQKSFIAQHGILKDGKLVSFSEIVHFDLGTKTERILTNDGFPKSDPVVSADGKWALYSVDYGSDGARIVMLHIPTGAKKEIFDQPKGLNGSPGRDFNPDWYTTPEEMAALK